MPVAGETIHVSSIITVSTVQLRGKSCRKNENVFPAHDAQGKTVIPDIREEQ